MKAHRMLALALMCLLVATGLMAAPTTEEVKEYLDDASITTQVKADFLKESSLKTSDISVETTDGTVHLTGTVESRTDSETAERVAKAAKGVRAVRNDLRVK